MKKTIYFLFSWLLFLGLPVLAEEKTKFEPFSTSTLQEKAVLKLNPGGITGIPDLLGRGITAMVMFMGTIALALVIYAGFMWMTAGGNETKIAKARMIIVWTLLGTIAIGASYGFVTFVIKIFG